MADAGQLSPDRQAWCAGLVRVGTRALDEYELRAVRRRVGSVRRAGALAVAAAASAAAANLAVVWAHASEPGFIAATAAASTLVTYAAFGVLLALMGRSSRLRLLAATGCVYLLVVFVGEHLASAYLGRSAGPWLAHLTRNIGVATLLVGLVAFFRAARAVWRTRLQARLALRDLDDLDCERYEGAPGPGIDPIIGRFAAECTLGPGDRHRLEVLPRSRVVVRANGHPVRRWRVAPRFDLAATRPHALRVPIHTRNAAPDVLLRRRALSPEEREEIRVHARRLTRQIRPVLAGAAAAITFPIVERAIYGIDAMPLGPGAFVWYGFSLLTIVGYGFRLRAAVMLRRDAELQWLVSVHEPGGDTLEQPPRMEVLPFSQLLWTEGERPAPWRAARG